MTEDQLYALKCFVDAKIQAMLAPSFANEQWLKSEEERLDKLMLPPSPQASEEANG